MSRQGMLAAAVITALPMIGDYYTADLLSGSPRTSMIGNQIEFYLFEGSQKDAGASLVVDPVGVLDGRDGVLPVVDRSRDARGAVMRAITRRIGAWWERPVAAARCSSPTVTWLYILWSIVPVLIADPVLVQLRTVAQHVAGLLVPLVVGRPTSGRCATTRPCARR